MIVDPVTNWHLSDLLGERRALVVEDDPELRRTMSEALTRMNFGVLSASHCEAGIGHLRRRGVDIACIDIGLPNESGYELCEYVRGTLKLTRLPIIVTSEHGTPTDMAHAENARANAFLRKPFSMREFSRCVQALLERKPGRAPPTHELALGYEGAGDGVAQPLRAYSVSPMA
jgi:DNA-binding response OmpR family regulator